MYTPRHFEETRIEVLHELMRGHPLGTLVAMTPRGLEASHIPFEIDPKPEPYGTLRCHLARANTLWRDLSAQTPVMVIFQGADGYISPSWYAAKREHGKVVPTWDYAVVHAHGVPTVIHDAAWLRKLVEGLTHRHEAGRADPWQVSDAPADYIEKLLGAIVGVEIPITRVVGQWKLSQNRSLADRQGVVAGLGQETSAGSADIADVVRATLK